VSKKLQEKQRKRLAEQARRAQARRASRHSNLLTAGIAAVVIAVVAALMIVDSRETAGVRAPAGVAAAAAGCTEVEDFKEGSQEHIDLGAQHEDYNSTPPTSGPHYGTPADPGFYPSPLPPEQLVHNLEHGQIVIWYRPDAGAETVEGLEALVKEANREAELQGSLPPLLAAPYEGVPGDYGYALTAWTHLPGPAPGRGHLRSCSRYSREAVNDFRAEFQGRGPESAGVLPFQE
jgi:hypothetical protein